MPTGRIVLTGKPRQASGRRDKLVTIQQSAPPTGGSFPADSWTALASAWMNRQDTQADERFAASQESGFVQTTWHMAYREDMDPDLVDVPARRRLLYQSRVYNIRAAATIGRKDGIELLTLAQSG